MRFDLPHALVQSIEDLVSGLRSRILFLAAICTFVAFGCRSTTTEVEHEEHFPPHWPKTIFVASERLRAIYSQSVNESSNPEISIEQEWFDLVKWLPELAADSDLSEQDFNQIDSISTQLQSKWQTSKLPPTLESIRSQADADSLLEKLHEICSVEESKLKQAHSD